MEESPAPKKRSRILDALANPSTLLSTPREVEPASDGVTAGENDSKASLDAIRRKILHASPAISSPSGAKNHVDERVRQRTIDAHGMGVRRQVVNGGSSPIAGPSSPTGNT
jgi:hypothetical protein